MNFTLQKTIRQALEAQAGLFLANLARKLARVKETSTLHGAPWYRRPLTLFHPATESLVSDHADQEI